MTAIRNGNNELAAQYLNTRLRGKAAADLAYELSAVLDRQLPARLNELSDNPAGSTSDPLNPNQELMGTILSGDRNVDIVIEHVNRGKAAALWLFSSKTLDSIPDLYKEIDVVSVDNLLPKFLVNTRFARIPLFEWLAVLVGIPLFYFLAALLNRLLSLFVGQVCRLLHWRPDRPDPEVLPKPIRILLLAVVIRWLLSKLSLPLLARQFWLTTASIIAIAGCVWLLILINGWSEGYIRRRLLGRNRTGATSVLRLTRRAIDVLIIFVGVMVTLYHFGVNPTAALAGVGVGGIAIAVAAQKTLENIIGGVSLISDRVVSVGDTLKVGDTLGTVADIGLRSTRIRTVDRTMVSVPNGQIATMSLENFSSRDKFGFHPILGLRYGTTSRQMCDVLESIRSLLEQNPQVEPDSIRVHFLRFGTSSLDVEVFAYVLASDWNQFLKIQEALLLRIMERVESAGTQIALPSQNIFMAPASTLAEVEVEGVVKASVPCQNTNEHATAKSA